MATRMIKNILAVLACFAFTPAAHAETFNLFEPASGVLVGNPNTYVTTAAASSNVISLWSGTCNASSFLRGDGSCAAAGAGTVTSVGLTVPTGFSVSGSPVTTSGTLGVTTALSGIINGTGSGFAAATSSDVIAEWSGTCDATTFLRGDGSCQSAAGAPGGSTTQVQYNNAGVFAGHAGFTYTSGGSRINLGVSGVSDGVIRGPTTTGVGTGVFVYLEGGAGGSTSGEGGAANLQGGTPTDGDGGSIQLLGAAGVGTNRNGGDIRMFTGAATGSGAAGTVTVNSQDIRDTALFTSGTLGVTRGGTGTTTSTGTGNVVLSASPTLTGTTTAATVAATAVTVGGNNVCQSTGTNCPAGLAETSGTESLTVSSGCTTTPSVTGTWRKIGTIVTLRIPTSNCTANGSTYSITTLSAGILPTNQQGFAFAFSCNSISLVEQVVITAGGALSVLRASNCPSGTANLGQFTMTYSTAL